MFFRIALTHLEPSKCTSYHPRKKSKLDLTIISLAIPYQEQLANDKDTLYYLFFPLEYSKRILVENQYSNWFQTFYN